MVRLCLAGLLITLCHSVAAAQLPAGVVDRALANHAFDWRRASTTHFRLDYLPEAVDQPALATLEGRLEVALSKNVDLLGTPYAPAPIRALFVGSRSQMAEVAGGPWGGVALVNDHAVAFVTSGGQAAVQHELMHLISYEAWGPPKAPNAWATEGLATVAPGACAGYTIRSLGALMLTSGELPSARMLVDSLSAVPEIRAYIGSASLVEYLMVAHGTPAFRVFWSEGFESGLSRLGITAEELDQKWRQFLSIAEPTSPSAWADIRRQGCEPL